MGIPARCESCGATFKAPDRFAGKRVRCVLCGKPVAVGEGGFPVGTSAAKAPEDEADFDWLAQAEREAAAVYEPLTAACPQCAGEVATTTEYLGRRIECPTCGERFPLRRPRKKRRSSRRGTPAWLEIASGGSSQRDQQRGKTFAAEDPQWSSVLSGLNLMYVGLWIQAGAAVFVLGSVLAALFGLFVIILIGAGGAIAMQGARSGDSGAARGSGYCGGFVIVLAGATICAYLRVALAMERFKEALLILPFIFIFAIIGAASEGKVFIGLLVLWAIVSVLAYPVVVVGWFRCASMPAYAGGKLVVASVVLLVCGLAASAVAALALLLKPPDLLAGQSVPVVDLTANSAVLVLAVSKGLFAWSLRRMAVFSGDAPVRAKSDMLLALQIVMVLVAAAGIGAALAGNLQPSLFVTLFLKAVSVVDLFLFQHVVDASRFLIR
jgi:hypothetical protein